MPPFFISCHHQHKGRPRGRLVDRQGRQRRRKVRDSHQQHRRRCLSGAVPEPRISCASLRAAGGCVIVGNRQGESTSRQRSDSLGTSHTIGPAFVDDDIGSARSEADTSAATQLHLESNNVPRWVGTGTCTRFE